MMNDVTIDDIDIAEGDFDDIDSTGDDADIFENVGDRIGKAVLKKRATVLTAFNQFLMRIGYVPNNFDELSTNQLNNFRDVMGQFPDYLMKVRKISNIKSNQNYISCIKEMIISRAPNSDIVQGAWYTRLRTNIEKMYVQAAMDNGTTLYTDSNYTNEHDLATLCRSLITDNTAISISMRSLYILKTTKIESQTARLVSGWNDPLYGGICPWIEAISENERESYKQELYNINCQSDEESRSFNLFKNAIRLLKRFLPDNSILEKRPISDHTSLRAWLHNLGRLSATIEDRSLAFCEQHKKPNNNPVRQRKLQPFFEGIYKRLNELSFDRRVQFPTPVGVVDRCMPNEMNSTV